MSFDKKFNETEIRAKLDIWFDHRTAEEFIFKSGLEHFSIMPVVKK